MPYAAPRIPETPYQGINSRLRRRFSGPIDSIAHVILGHAVCSFFQATVVVHVTLRHVLNGWNERLVWAASCGLVAVLVGCSSCLASLAIVTFRFSFQTLLYYVAVYVAAAGIGLGFAGFVVAHRSPAAPRGKSADGKVYGSKAQKHQEQQIRNVGYRSVLANKPTTTSSDSPDGSE